MSQNDKLLFYLATCHDAYYKFEPCVRKLQKARGGIKKDHEKCWDGQEKLKALHAVLSAAHFQAKGKYLIDQFQYLMLGDTDDWLW